MAENLHLVCPNDHKDTADIIRLTDVSTKYPSTYM